MGLALAFAWEFQKRNAGKLAWQKSAGTRLTFSFSYCIGDSPQCPWMSRCSESIHLLFVVIAFISLSLLSLLISSHGLSTGFCIGISEKDHICQRERIVSMRMQNKILILCDQQTNVSFGVCQQEEGKRGSKKE